MKEQIEESPILSWQNELEEENYSLSEEDCLHNAIGEESRPELYAAICAALLACGLLNDNFVITAIRPLSPWRMAGILDLMVGRDLNR